MTRALLLTLALALAGCAVLPSGRVVSATPRFVNSSPWN